MQLLQKKVKNKRYNKFEYLYEKEPTHPEIIPNTLTPAQQIKLKQTNNLYRIDE